MAVNRLLILSASAGAGHVRAAEALVKAAGEARAAREIGERALVARHEDIFDAAARQHARQDEAGRQARGGGTGQARLESEDGRGISGSYLQ